ncbi:MAG TPA: hypothetical protein VHV82_07060 [Sporichthyaceae bacterium]|jgi:alpha-tubulin suppressor-like RCC1 family protein|nr:hypothetical protein [Sporichthyaceae bacterium]
MRLEFGRRLGAAAAAALLIGSALSPGGAQASAAVDRPQDPPRAPRFVKLAAGGVHTCGLTAAGNVYCWGENPGGEYRGGKLHKPGPVAVSGPHGSDPLSGVSAVTAGGLHTCALFAGGAVYCWGYNNYGELGNGTIGERAGAVTGLPAEAVAITAGGNHSCALLATGAVYCWGDNHDGQLGTGTTTDSPTPTAVTGLPAKAVAVTAGYYHTCALLATGAVYCWGYNYYGELGHAPTHDPYTPTPRTVTGFDGRTAKAVAITAGFHHTCALLATGTVDCWGDNHEGELGDGTARRSYVPVAVAGPGRTGRLSGVRSLAAGGFHTCAVTDTGTWCWGENHDGELGDGTTRRSPVPVAVAGPGGTGRLSGVSALTAGDEHTCALTGTGTWCWGYNDDGQLGDGTEDSSHAPVAVER